MSSLINLIVEFLASIAAAVKVRQQTKAAEELPRGEIEVKAIGEDVAAIKAELAKLSEPPIPEPKPEPKLPMPPS